jgi:hypothetical protein
VPHLSEGGYDVVLGLPLRGEEVRIARVIGRDQVFMHQRKDADGFHRAIW